jgi:hypothetical protein
VWKIAFESTAVPIFVGSFPVRKMSGVISAAEGNEIIDLYLLRAQHVLFEAPHHFMNVIPEVIRRVVAVAPGRVCSMRRNLFA